MQDGVQGVQFRCSGSAAQHQCVGLNSDDPDKACDSIDFALVCRNGLIDIRESGSSRGTFGAYETSDLLQVRVNRQGQVEYVRNDAVLYTSNVAPNYPLGVDTSFNNPSGRVDDIEWIGLGTPAPDYNFELDNSVGCSSCSSTGTASYVGGQAKWDIEQQPTGADGTQSFFEWREMQSAGQGTDGTSGTAGDSSEDHWISTWVSAIARKAGFADSDVVRSSRYFMRRIVAAPEFSPDGGTHDAHLRSIPVSLSSSTEGASIRYSVGGTPSCGADFTTCSGTKYNNCAGYCSSSFVLGPANLATAQIFTVKAIAYRDTWSNSDVTTAADYTVKQVVARPTFSPNGGVFATSPVSVTISCSTSSATITYTTAVGQEAAVYPTTVGSTYTSAVDISSTMGVTSTAVATTAGRVNLTAIATKSGWANSDVFANLFSVTEVSQWSDSNGVAVSSAAYDFVRSGLKCSDVLECKATDSGDTTSRTAELELATGECVCK
jgi:hypothetical protein